MVFQTILNGMLIAVGSFELLGFALAVIFVYFLFTSHVGKETAVILGVMLLFALNQQGFINQTIFYLAIVIMAFFTYKVFSNFGRQQNA